MWSYLGRRLLLSVVVLWAVLTTVFCLMRFLPGDPVGMMLRRSGGSEARIAELRHQFGLDQPTYVQYARFVAGVARGDLGRSLFTGRPVVEMILEQLPSTIELATTALIIGVALGMLLGIVSALHEGSWVDNLCMVFAAAGISMPSFWFGLLMIYVFSITLGWLPSTGQGGLRPLIMPATVLGFGVAATVARLVRSSMIEVMQEEFITTARAKGLVERLVIMRHALKNAMIPVVTMIGLEFGWLLGGAVVIETVFARQGLGRLAVHAVLGKDFALVQGTVLFAAVFYLSVNLVVDIVYAFLDPRISVQ